MKQILTALFILFIFILGACSGPSKPKQLWKIKLPHSTAGLNGLHKNILFISAGEYMEFGSPNHILFAINSEDGKIIWKKDAGKDSIMGNVIFQENHLFWQDNEQKTSMVLKVHSGDKIEPAPLLSAQKGSKDQKENLERIRLKKEGMKTISLLSIGAAKKHWQYHAKNPIVRYIRTGPLVLIATKNDRKITALSLKNGKEIWSVDVPLVKNVKYPEAVNFSFSLYYDKLFVVNYDAEVIAYQVPLKQ